MHSSQPMSARIPFRNRLKPDECITLRSSAHAGQLSLAAEAAGRVARQRRADGSAVSAGRKSGAGRRGTDDRHSGCPDAQACSEGELPGLRLLAGPERDRARARGWGSPGTQVNLGGQAQLIVQNVTITPVEHNKFLDDVADGSLTIEGSLEGAGTDTGEP